MPGDYDRIEVSSREEWRAWLAARHADSPGVWVVTFKKAAGERYLRYEAVVEEALCFGWVDTQGRRVDDLRTSLLVTPRRARSRWGRPNRERVERLEREGRLHPAGRVAIEEAKAAGTWDPPDT